MAVSLAEADRLLERAARRRPAPVLAVGHAEFYNPAVQALVGLGIPPRFLEVQRLAAFTPRSLDVDVILDLMIHDLQILHALDGSEVAEVRATGIPVLSPRIDIANARVALASGCVANLTVSRVSAERVRKLRVFLPSRYYSLDFQAQEIRGYRLDSEREEGDGGERRIVPDDLAVEPAEPLERELTAFLAACRGEPARWVDGAQGRRALATALAVAVAAAAAG
jgi:predicted dehydrogenase